MSIRAIVKSRSSIMTKTGLIITISLVLGVLFDYFFYGKILGLAFPVYVLLIIGGLFAISRLSKQQINKGALWLLTPLAFISVMVFVRSSLLLSFLNVMAVLALLLLLTEVTWGKRLKNFLVSDFLKIIFTPLHFVLPFFRTVTSLFSPPKISTDQKVITHVVKGVLMTMPVLFVFLALFSSADLIFQKYISDLGSIHLNPELIFRCVLVSLAASALIGAYAYTFRDKNEQDSASGQTIKHTVGRIEGSILLGSVNVLFLIFILIQLTYLFGGESNITAQGFSYAEYARRGFFELITVAVISLILLFAAEKYVVKKAVNHTLWFKILSSFLVFQVLIIMTSAFIRLSLYEQAYGFTTLRLYSHAFIVLLAVVLCLLLYKIHRDTRANSFALRVFVAVIMFLVAMNFLNPDAFIARRNIERFESTGKLDTYYLGYLSDDAVPAMVEFFSDLEDGDTKNYIADELYGRIQNDNPDTSVQWQSLNVSRMRAEKILNSNVSELEQYANQ